MTPSARRRATRLLARLSRGASKVVALPRTRALLALLQEEGYHVGALSITMHVLEPERRGEAERVTRALEARLVWPGLGVVNEVPVRVLPDAAATAPAPTAAPRKRVPRTLRPPRRRPPA